MANQPVDHAIKVANSGPDGERSQPGTAPNPASTPGHLASKHWRWGVIGAALILAVAGFIELRNAPIDVYPEFEQTTVVIQTEALGLSAAEVERLVAVPMEEVLAAIPFVTDIRSQSVPGLSRIELIFEPGTDTLTARQLAGEPLASSFTLPAVASTPVVIQPLSATNRVMMVGMTSDELSLIQMSVLARWNITPKLLGVDGVANVSVWGNRERQLQVQTDPDLLREQGVTLEQVISTTGDSLWVSSLSFLRASVPGTGGWIDTPTQRLGIRHVLPISTPEDLAAIPVDGTSLRLDDVADIVEGHPPIIGDAFLETNAALLLVVEKFPGASTPEVTRGIEEALQELRPGLSGIALDSTVFRAATYIEQGQDNLILVATLASLLLVVLLGMFFLNWRMTLIAVGSMAVSLLTAGFILIRLGATLNLIVLTGFVVAAGAVMADSTISVASVRSRLRGDSEPDLTRMSVAELNALAAENGFSDYSGKGKSELLDLLDSGSSGERAIDSAWRWAARPVVYGTLIGALALMPVFFMEGSTGSFFGPLALAYVIALACSMMVSLLLTPVLSVLLLSKAPRERRESRILTTGRHLHRRLLAPLARRRAVALVVGVALVGGGIGVALASFESQVTIPDFEERDLRVSLESSPGTSPTEMARLMARASNDLRSIPGVGGVAGQVGRAETGDQAVGTNAGQLWLNIEPGAEYARTLESIRTAIDRQDGLTGHIAPYIGGEGLHAANRAPRDVVVRIYGPELEVLRGVAGDVSAALSTVEGLRGIAVETREQEPQVEIEVDLARAQFHGLKPGDVRRAAATVFAGIPVGSLFEEQKVFQVSVWSKPEARGSVENLNELLVDKPDGSQVQLSEVADVRIVDIPTLINHDAASGYLDVVADIDGRATTALEETIDERLAQVGFPLEYNSQVRIDALNRQADQARMISFVVAALIGIFLLLQLALDSWRLAFLSFASLLAALAGSAFAAIWWADGITTLASLAGMAAVLGIAVRSAILIVRRCLELERADSLTGSELIMRAARDQFAPISMTIAVLAAVVIPVVALGTRAGLEVLYPMSLVLLGGLLTTALVYLFLVPVVYPLFAGASIRTSPQIPSPPDGDAPIVREPRPTMTTEVSPDTVMPREPTRQPTRKLTP